MGMNELLNAWEQSCAKVYLYLSLYICTGGGGPRLNRFTNMYECCNVVFALKLRRSFYESRNLCCIYEFEFSKVKYHKIANCPFLLLSPTNTICCRLFLLRLCFCCCCFCHYLIICYYHSCSESVPHLFFYFYHICMHVC